MWVVARVNVPLYLSFPEGQISPSDNVAKRRGFSFSLG